MSGMMGFQLTPGYKPQQAAPTSDDDVIEMLVSVRIHGDDLDPHKITEVLSMKPSVSAKKGESLATEGRRPVLAETGTWYRELFSRRLTPGPWFIPSPTPVCLYIRRAIAGFDAEIDLSILFIGTPERVAQELRAHTAELVEFMTAEAEFGDVDLDVPNLGIDWMLGKGETVEDSMFLAEIGLDVSDLRPGGD